MGWVIFTTRSNIHKIYSHPFNGKVTKVKNYGKGSLGIWLSNSETDFSISGLGFKQYKDLVSVGDSLYKEKDSYVIFIYKPKPEGGYSLYYKYKVYSGEF